MRQTRITVVDAVFTVVDVGDTVGEAKDLDEARQTSDIRGDPNGKYNGHTAQPTVNGVDTSDVNRKLSDKEFDDPDVRTYILNRRLFLKKNNSSYSNDRKIKEMVMEIAQTIMDKKRSGEDDSNPRDDKKQKGEKEKDPWNLMGKGAD
jgi:hypothetical protein